MQGKIQDKKKLKKRLPGAEDRRITGQSEIERERCILDAVSREQLDELRGRAQRVCDETRRLIQQAKRNIKWSEEFIACSEQLSAATADEIVDLLKVCKISARLINKRSSLVERSACEFLLQQGSKAIAFLRERAEIDREHGDELSADIWRDVANAAEGIWLDAA